MAKIFGLLDKLAGIKAGVEDFFGALSFLLKAKDRIDDDLDGNGKSELQDIYEKIQEIEEEAVAFVKELIADILDIVHRVQKLQAHIMEK